MAFYRGYTGYRRRSIATQLRRRRRASVRNMSRAMAGKSATIRKYSAPFRPRYIRKVAQAVKRSMAVTIEREVFYLQGNIAIASTTGFPQAPAIQILTSPVTWTRTFANSGSSTILSKSHVRLDSMSLACHWNLKDATAAKCFKVYFYIVSLTRQGQIVFPSGMTGAGTSFVPYQTHVPNFSGTNLFINKDLFNVYYSKVFIMGTTVDGAGNAITNIHDSSRQFTFSRRFKNFIIKSELDSWSLTSEAELMPNQRIYFMFWSAPLDNTLNYLSPKLYWQVKYNLSCGN